MSETNNTTTIRQDQAAILINPDGTVEVLMPDQDTDSDGNISTDSPSFKALVIMAFIKDQDLREQVARTLVEDHFSSPSPILTI